MYPNLLAPLLICVAVALVALVLVAVRQPVSRRLAFRQVARRRTEAALVVSGSVLGTAIIVAALVVGDTLNFSVRQEAYRTLGPVDERVVATSPAFGAIAANRLSGLSADPNVDGVLTAQTAPAAASVNSGGGTLAEPLVLAWQTDFTSASHFGAPGGDSGLTGAAPPPGQVVVNQPLASSLHLRPGRPLTLFLFGRPQQVTVDRIVPERGLAGMGLGAQVNRNVFVAPGALDAAAQAAGTSPTTVTLISNRGGVESGEKLTPAVTADIRRQLGPMADTVTVDAPKHTVLQNARTTGDVLGALFLMIGSFSIIAGALLLVNVFVMLAEERKPQLGMVRAMGMKRSRLVGSFTLEGSCYALASIVPGLVIGTGVGWAVALVAAQIFRSWSAGGSGLQIAFAVTPTSLVNGAALGLVIALAAVLATTLRISRFNIIAAIRDLPAQSEARTRRRLLVVSSALAVLCAVASVPALARSQAETTYLLPALAMAFSAPALMRVLSRRAATSLVAGAVLLWTLLASVVRPDVYDSPSMAVYVIDGTLTAFAAVVLVSENQSVLLRPVRRLLERPSQTGVAARLAVAYPLTKRFRTGATLVMYTLIVLVLVLLTEITGIMNAGIDRSVADATAGYSLRLDYNPQAGGAQLPAQLRSGPQAHDIAAVTPLLDATGHASDPGHRTGQPLQTSVVGVPDDSMSRIAFAQRLPGLGDDQAVWRALATHPDYAVLDPFFGSTGGPAGKFYQPGDTFTLTDPRTGRTERLTIAGVLKSGLAFYPRNGTAGSSSTYPTVMSASGVTALFGSDARVGSALVRSAPGVSPDALATRLQGTYLPDSLVATPIATDVRHLFAANTAFFRLMQGFLALGLLVGVTGLGVVMVRAVRERRRTIGILRALGCRAKTIERSFLWESGFIAGEGIVIGSALGVLTTWLMYQKSAAFQGLSGGFPIEWASIGILAAATLATSLLAALGPARRAAGIRPALAVRVAE